MGTRRFEGCIIGGAIGDTVGAPLEFWDRDRVATHPLGREWIDEMLPSIERRTHPYGVWRVNPPLGTGTDDTRLNQVFVESVIKYGPMINSRLLAAEFVDRYVNRDRHYPGYHDLSAGQFALTLDPACGLLGLPSPIHPNHPQHVLRSWAAGRGAPSLWGILALASAGLLHPGDPEAAYRKAFELDLFSIGYARDATALLAAMVAAGVDGTQTPREAIEAGLATDPYDLGADRTMLTWIRRFLRMADQARTDKEMVLAISEAVQHLNTYDPAEVMGMAVAAAYRAEGEPRRAILMAVNDREFDDEGQFRRFRDIDCTGSVCGALVGALIPGGIDAFPPTWVEAAISANREVYGFDLAENARAMYEAVAV